MTNRLTEIFGTRNVLCDGAMGTSLYARGIFINRCYDELNVSQPELVRNVHEEYLQAGAEIIETNTFGANALRLQRYGFADRVVEINRAGAQIARKAVNQRAVNGVLYNGDAGLRDLAEDLFERLNRAGL